MPSGFRLAEAFVEIRPEVDERSFRSTLGRLGRHSVSLPVDLDDDAARRGIGGLRGLLGRLTGTATVGADTDTAERGIGRVRGRLEGLKGNAVLGLDTDEFDRGISSANRKLRDTEHSGVRAFGSIGSSGSRAGVALTGLVGVLGGVSLGLGAAGGAAGFFGIKTAAANEQAMIAFTQFLGSGERARAFLGQLADFAARTPFELPGLREAASRMLGAGFAAQQVIPMLTAVGDAVAAVGGNAEQVDRATLALTQMQIKGRVTGEEMLQLTEAGIPAFKVLAAAMGVDVATAQDKVSAGQVQVNTLFDAISGYVGPLGAVKGMMDKQSESAAGLWSTLKDTIGQGLGTLLAPGLAEIKNLMPGISDALQGLMGDLGPEVGTLVSGVLRSFQALAPAIGPLIGGFVDLVGRAFHGLAPVLAPIATLIGENIRQAFAYLAPVLYELVPQVSAMIAAFAPLFPQLIQLIPPLVQIAVALTPLIVLFARFQAFIAGLLLPGLTGAANVIAATLVPALNWLTGAVDSIGSFFASMWATVQPILMGFGAAVLGTLVGAFRVLQAVGMAVWNALATAIGVWWSFAQPIFSFVGGTVRDVLVHWFNVFGTVASTVFNTVGGVISWWWNSIVKPVWNFVGSYISGVLVPYFHFLSGVVSAVFNAIGNVIGNVWATTIRPVWAAIQGFIATVLIPAFHSLSGPFAAVWRGIADVARRIWDEIQGTFSGGLRFVGDVVGRVLQIASSIARVVGATGVADSLNRAAGSAFGWGQAAAGARLDNQAHFMARGGRIGSGFVTNKPRAIVGEGGPHPEFVIPTDPVYRGNAEKLTKQLLVELGYPQMQAGGILGSGVAAGLAGLGIGAVRSLAGEAAERWPVMGMQGNLPHDVPAGGMNRVRQAFIDFIKAKEVPELGGMGAPGAYQAMFAAAKRVFPFLRLISGFRPGSRTLGTNRLSYHAQGRAIDIDPNMAVFDWIAANYGAKTKELIFSPAGGRQIHNGRPHVYTGITRATHWDHIHWAMQRGGILGAELARYHGGGGVGFHPDREMLGVLERGEGVLSRDAMRQLSDPRSPIPAGPTVVIHVHPSPGMDEAALARKVGDRLGREAALLRRSS